jgi:hypothetical protein
MEMGLKGLAEAIILQSMEDAADRERCEDAVAFFKGLDFIICAEIAGLDTVDQIRLLTMARFMIEKTTESCKLCGKGLEQTNTSNSKDIWC